jgi:signal peptidase
MWYLILGFLILIYLLRYTIISGLGFVESSVIGPFLWIVLATLCILLAQKEGISILKFTRVRRWRLGDSPVHAGLLIGGFQVSLLIIVGLFTGFGDSPYSFTSPLIFLNILFVSTLLLGTEVSRAYLIRRGTRLKRHLMFTLSLTTILYVAMQLTPAQITTLTTASTALILEFIGKILITSIALNLLASYLSYMGGASASIAYVGPLLAFEWFSPILPNPNWTLLALIGTIAPAIGFLMIQNTIREHGERKQRFHRKKSREWRWTAVAFFSIVSVFFSFGYVGVKPTIIYSGSMSPAFEVGDIALIQKVDTSTIKPGDIIQFVIGNETILHRVYRVDTAGGTTQYITKGDANKYPDINPVPAPNILGKSIFSIPKLGWTQLFVKEIIRKIGIPS